MGRNMFDFAALERRVAALEANRGASLRFGTVTGVDAANGSARVQLEDGDGMVSAPLRVLQRRSLKDKAQCLPDIGEPVACLFAGQGMEAGVVLGAHYSTQTPAPDQTATHDYTVYEDGTEVWYDRKGHKLIAKVKGDAEVETEGQITARAKKSIRLQSSQCLVLRAPDIRLEGNLSHQGYSGGKADSILNGSCKIYGGDVHVPDGDVTAGTISVRSHSHTGVESGPDNSGPPQDSGGDSGSASFGQALFETVCAQLPEPLQPQENILLCLPEIAEAEAEKRLLDMDKKGWRNLRDMFHRWFAGRANPDAESNPHGFFVDMDWALSYARIRSVYRNFIMDDVLFHEKARNTLAAILHKDGFLGTTRMAFDYTAPQLHPESVTPWQEWKHGYFQRITVPGSYILPVDGISACLGQFDFRALAAGHTEPLNTGGHRIVVEKVGVFIWDSFNFNKEDELGYWSCEQKDFTLVSSFADETYIQIYNTHFATFREKYGLGEDFIVLSHVKNVDHMLRFSYDTDL